MLPPGYCSRRRRINIIEASIGDGRGKVKINVGLVGGGGYAEAKLQLSVCGGKPLRPLRGHLPFQGRLFCDGIFHYASPERGGAEQAVYRRQRGGGVCLPPTLSCNTEANVKCARFPNRGLTAPASLCYNHPWLLKGSVPQTASAKA